MPLSYSISQKWPTLLLLRNKLRFQVFDGKRVVAGILNGSLVGTFAPVTRFLLYLYVFKARSCSHQNGILDGLWPIHETGALRL
jgi:hypothetical protein